MDAYLDDVHNNPIDKDTKKPQKPLFGDYLKGFELLTRMYQIDNIIAKKGLKSQSNLVEPTSEQQREAYKKLMEFNIQSKNQIFHIVST